jgi:hypothetical protein
VGSNDPLHYEPNWASKVNGLPHAKTGREYEFLRADQSKLLMFSSDIACLERAFSFFRCITVVNFVSVLASPDFLWDHGLSYRSGMGVLRMHID